MTRYSSYDDVIVLRLAVGLLGEREQAGWWTSAFTSPASSAFLGPVFGAKVLQARYQGLLEAARRVHDERIGVGRAFRAPRHGARPPGSYEPKPRYRGQYAKAAGRCLSRVQTPRASGRRRSPREALRSSQPSLPPSSLTAQPASRSPSPARPTRRSERNGSEADERARTLRSSRHHEPIVIAAAARSALRVPEPHSALVAGGRAERRTADSRGGHGSSGRTARHDGEYIGGVVHDDGGGAPATDISEGRLGRRLIAVFVRKLEGNVERRGGPRNVIAQPGRTDA